MSLCELPPSLPASCLGLPVCTTLWLGLFAPTHYRHTHMHAWITTVQIPLSPLIKAECSRGIEDKTDYYCRRRAMSSTLALSCHHHHNQYATMRPHKSYCGTLSHVPHRYRSYGAVCGRHDSHRPITVASPGSFANHKIVNLKGTKMWFLPRAVTGTGLFTGCFVWTLMDVMTSKSRQMCEIAVW